MRGGLAFERAGVVVDLAGVEHRVAALADVDERRLHARQHVLHLAEVDVADHRRRGPCARRSARRARRPRARAIWVRSPRLPHDHDPVDRLAAGEELRLGDDRRPAAAGVAAVAAALALGLEPGRALDALDVVVGRRAAGAGPRRGLRLARGRVRRSRRRRRRRRPRSRAPAGSADAGGGAGGGRRCRCPRRPRRSRPRRPSSSRVRRRRRRPRPASSASLVASPSPAAPSPPAPPRPRPRRPRRRRSPVGPGTARSRRASPSRRRGSVGCSPPASARIGGVLGRRLCRCAAPASWLRRFSAAVFLAAGFVAAVAGSTGSAAPGRSPP